MAADHSSQLSIWFPQPHARIRPVFDKAKTVKESWNTSIPLDWGIHQTIAPAFDTGYAIFADSHGLAYLRTRDAKQINGILSPLQESSWNITFSCDPFSDRSNLEEHLPALFRHYRSSCGPMFITRILIPQEDGPSLRLGCAIFFQLPCQNPSHTYCLFFRWLEMARNDLKGFCGYEVLNLYAFCPFELRSLSSTARRRMAVRK